MMVGSPGESTARTAPSNHFMSTPGGDGSAKSITLPADLRSEYTNRTVEALNQFSQYTKNTVTDSLDLRCEFDLPRFKNLKSFKPLTPNEDHQNFLWF